MKCCCENCGWLEVNPSGAMFCGYSDERTWKDECCMAWKDKDEPKTNADRNRAMTDEELAEVIKNPCDMGLHMPNEWCKKRNCGYQCSLDWLKQEVEE